MTTLSNSLEGGTNTATITTSNSGGGSGDAFGFVQGSPIYDNTRAAHGSQSAKLTPVSGSVCSVQLGATGSGWNSTQFAARFYAYFTANPSSTFTLFRANDDTLNANQMLRLNYDNLGKLVLTYGTGSTTATPWTSTSSVPLNQWVRIEVRMEKSAGAGFVAAAFYPADSTTATDSFSSASTLTTGTLPLTAATFGKYGTDTTATAFWLDDLKVDTARTSFIGAVNNVAPTVSLTANQNVSAGATVNVAATAADSDGTIASYTWSVIYSSTTSPTLTGGTTANVSFTAPAAGHLVKLQCVVTDDQGATATATTEVRVPLSTDFTTLPGVGSGDAWTNTGGAASEGVALSDSSDTTYVESPALTGTASVHKFRLQPLTPRTSLVLTSRTYESPSGSGTLLVRLLENTTQRQQWTVTTASTATDQTLTVTTPGAITDWGNLWVEYSVAT